MATGELIRPGADDAELEYGSARTNSGRISAAKMYEPAEPEVPFTAKQLARLDEALTLASRETGLDFSIYLGELAGENTREVAEGMHDTLGERSADAVLIAVSPGQKVVEVVTGDEARLRLTDRGAKLAVMSMVASFKEGDLVGGLVSGLRMLTDQAGQPPK